MRPSALGLLVTVACGDAAESTIGAATTDAGEGSETAVGESGAAQESTAGSAPGSDPTSDEADASSGTGDPNPSTGSTGSPEYTACGGEIFAAIPTSKIVFVAEATSVMLEPYDDDADPETPDTTSWLQQRQSLLLISGMAENLAWPVDFQLRLYPDPMAPATCGPPGDVQSFGTDRDALLSAYDQIEPVGDRSVAGILDGFWTAEDFLFPFLRGVPLCQGGMPENYDPTFGNDLKAAEPTTILYTTGYTPVGTWVEAPPNRLDTQATLNDLATDADNDLLTDPPFILPAGLPWGAEAFFQTMFEAKAGRCAIFLRGELGRAVDNPEEQIVVTVGSDVLPYGIEDSCGYGNGWWYDTSGNLPGDAQGGTIWLCGGTCQRAAEEGWSYELLCPAR